MKRPDNPDDLAQCVKLHRDIVYIWCVECDDWKQVDVLANCDVLTDQVGHTSIRNRGAETFICSACDADAGYLLPENWRQAVRNRAKTAY